MAMNRMMNRRRELPSSESLLAEARRLFEYDASNGNLIWKSVANRAHPGKAKVGAIVGGDDGNGYRMCALLGHKFKVHQVVWLLQAGSLASHPLDHANRDRRDNRIENLREVTDSQNVANSVVQLRPLAGVKKDSKGRGYSASITVNHCRKYLGYFATAELAHAAYLEATRNVRGDFSPV
jgi:hypothetical protein